MNDIPVMILCGGLGTRLREETEFRPKPLVTIGNNPILWHIMKIYSHHGFNNFILCLGYKGEVIKKYFLDYEVMNKDLSLTLGSQKIEFHNSYSEKNWRVTLCDTGMEAMTGARIKRAQKYIGNADIVMITYGDGVADIDIRKLLEFHRAHGKIATVTGVHPSSRFGELVVENDLAKRFAEKPQVNAAIVNGGFFVVNRDFFNYLTANDDCVLEQQPLENLAKDSQLAVYRHEGFWHCMDTYRDNMVLSKMWNSGKAEWKIWE